MSRATVLRKLREDAGLTQVQLANRIGVTSSVLSAYENGKREPRVDVFFRAVEATGHEVVLDWQGSETGLERVVPDAAMRARTLVQLWGLAMAMPSRERGPLTYPPFRTLVQGAHP